MATGIGLAEVYDVDPSANAQPTNLSARAFVGTGNDVLIGGTIIRGNGTSLLRVLVRALGPSAIAATGKAPPNDNESAILGLLAPGNYTAMLPEKTELRALP